MPARGPSSESLLVPPSLLEAPWFFAGTMWVQGRIAVPLGVSTKLSAKDHEALTPTFAKRVLAQLRDWKPLTDAVEVQIYSTAHACSFVWMGVALHIRSTTYMTKMGLKVLNL